VVQTTAIVGPGWNIRLPGGLHIGDYNCVRRQTKTDKPIARVTSSFKTSPSSLQVSVARQRRRSAHGLVSPAGSDRRPVERIDGDRCALPGRARGLHRAVPQGGPDAADSATALSEPEQDFTGGEFVLTEQRPRMQSRAEVVPLRRGDGVIFAVHNRPMRGTRGTYRVNLRHGVSRLRSGHRHTLCVIFHDAK
jgi:hypothetical protein